MKKYNEIIFSLVGMLFALGGLLSQGYILTLDMVFGPHPDMSNASLAYGSEFVLNGIISMLSRILDGWMVQKIILVSLFFILFYIPIQAFKSFFPSISAGRSKYVAAIFFAWNPFVYERFLAGQWKLLFGYAFALFAFSQFAKLMAPGASNEPRPFKLLVISLTMTGIFSPHVLAMTAVMMSGIYIFALVFNAFRIGVPSCRIPRSQILRSGLCLLVPLVTLLPTLILGSDRILAIDRGQWNSFAFAAGTSSFDKAVALVTEQGFWLEGQPWASRFVIHSNYASSAISIGALMFFSLPIFGLACALAGRRFRKLSAGILLVMLLAGALSLGISETPLKNLNVWLFEHIPLWRGFRDTQKWSAFIAAGYALLAGIGANFLFLKIRTETARRIMLYGLMAVPFLYLPMMAGFSNQLRAAEYPESWYDVDSFMQKVQGCKAVFLPWHLYYSLSFNDGILTANPSGKFFHCRIIHSLDMELGDSRPEPLLDAEYELTKGAVTANSTNPQSIDDSIRKLKDLGVSYVLVTPDVEGEDRYDYPFLNSDAVEKVMDKEDIQLYKVL